jgi:HD-like signal output (HDOD) protein
MEFRMHKGIDATNEAMPTSGSLIPHRRGKLRSAVKAILAHPDCPVAVPALPESAKRLLALPEKGRRDARILALLAQKDPVFLARLLCQASGSGCPREGIHAITAEEAISALGVPASLSAMLAIAEESPISLPLESIGSPLSMARQFVLRRCLSNSLTAQRLARYLELSSAHSSMLHLACLLDSLGLHVGLYAEHASTEDIRRELSAKAASSSHALRDCEAVADYHLLSAHLAGHWGADRRIVEMLAPDGGSMHALLVAVERMVEARMRGESQQRALAEAVAGHPCWQAKIRPEDIYLAVMPW